MNKILFVDIDTATLNEFSNLLEAHPDKFEILTAGSAREVPNIVSGIKISMMLIDLKMPDIDDLEFLAYMSKNYAKIPIIVMTAFGTPEIAAKIRQLETCRYYEKPIDIDSLGEKILEELDSVVSGQIHGIGLSSFLQMSEMEKTTCKLKIKSEDNIGYLYLQKGELVDAETGLKTGNEAAFEIISWDETVIEIEKAGGKRKKEIAMPLMTILMEGLRIKDEKEAEKKKAEGPKKKKVVKKKKAAPKKKDPQKEAGAEGQETVKGPGGKKGVKVVDAAKQLKRKKTKTVLAVVLILMMVAVAGGMSWVHFIQPRQIKNEYDKVLAAVESHTTLEEKEFELQNYTASHENSPYVSDARSKILEVRSLIRERDFQRMLDQVNSLAVDKDYLDSATALFKGYLSRYPGSNHKAEIQQKIAALPNKVEESDYQALQSIAPDDYQTQIIQYRAYLDNYPQGKYRAPIKKKMKKLGDSNYSQLKAEVAACNRKNDWESCIQLAETYLVQFKGHRRHKAVRLLKKKMQDEQVIYELKNKSGQEGTDLEKARKIYLDYIVANPDTSLNKRIKEELTKINRKIREKNTWEKMVAYARNRRVDIFERSEKFESYLTEKAPPRYKKEAAKITRQIQKEKAEEIRRRKLQAAEKRKEQERIAALQRERARIEKEKKTIGKQLSASGGSFSVKGDGTVRDTRTGLEWYVLDTHVELRKCIDYDEARNYIRNLSAGGHRDWRLPTSNELMVLLNSKPSFPDSGATWYWTSESYWKGYHEFVNIVKDKKKQWAKGETDLTKCGAVRAVRP